MILLAGLGFEGGIGEPGEPGSSRTPWAGTPGPNLLAGCQQVANQATFKAS